jgi:hypothetical protein
MTATSIRHQPSVAHLSPASSVPATGGSFTVTDMGALFPRAEVSHVLRADGRRGVDLFLVGDGPGATFTPTEARMLADALRAEADLAEGVGL